MLSDEDFIEEIWARPDDDEPRLVYADWLEERGDQRSAFIRVQCELAVCDDKDRRGALKATQQRLLARFGKLWFDSLWGKEATLRFERGLLAEVRASQKAVNAFLRGPDRRCWAPRRLQIVNGQTDMTDCVEVVRRLAESSWSLRLEELELPHCRLVAASGIRLAESVRLRRLRSLNVSWNPCLGDEGIVALAESSRLSGLRLLDLHGVMFGRDAITALRASPLAKQLELLIVSPPEATLMKRYLLGLRESLGERLMFL